MTVAIERVRSQTMGPLMTLIPDDPDALLTRDQVAAALTAVGFPVKAKTLETKATRGGGPRYKLFGTRPLYRWGDVLCWAEQRLTSPRCTKSGKNAATDLTRP